MIFFKAEGDLYTFGYGHYGVLGLNKGDTSEYTPNLVSFFRENNLRVKDVVVGQYHTAAVTGISNKNIHFKILYRKWTTLHLGFWW